MIPVDWKSFFEPTHARPGVSSNTRTVRIEWADCDPAGIVFYPRYFEIFDAATAALFERALGMTMFQMFRTFEAAGCPLARTRARFIRPTRYGDDVTIDSAIQFSRASFEIEHRLSLNNLVCVQCTETRVWVVRDVARPGEVRSHPVPEALLEKFRA